jgi:hypothetical protein
MRRKPFTSKKVETVFDSYPKHLRRKLDQVRDVIFEVATSTEGVGPLEETLKWGQPSYLTNDTQSGTTVRIGRLGWEKDKYALLVHCQSDVLNQFRTSFGKEFDYDGNRGIILDAKNDLPEEAVRHFIWLALTYHLRKKKGKKL